MALRLASASRATLLRPAFRATPLGARFSSGSPEAYTDRMKRLGRPVSPALTIYAFPMAALSSVTVRITGCLLTAGCTGIAVASLVHPDLPGLVSAFAASGIAPLAKFSVSFPLLYHYLGAMRHAVWDSMPETVHNASAEQTSWALFGVASVGAVGISSMSLKKKEEQK